MKHLKFKRVIFLLVLSFSFISCENDNSNDIEEIDEPDTQEVSILGEWQMSGSTEYGLEFTNYGIVKWKHKRYMDSNLNYTYSGTTLTVSDINGTGVFSDNGNKLIISGFSDPSSFGAEGTTGPYINGTYVRQ